MPVDQDRGFPLIPGQRKRTLGLYAYESDVYIYGASGEAVGTTKDIGLGVLVERPDWGSLWCWPDGVGRDDVRRLAAWLESVAKSEQLQPPLEIGVDETVADAQVTFEHPERRSIRLRFRGDASPAKVLDEFQYANPPYELVVDLNGIRTNDVREAADSLRRSMM